MALWNALQDTQGPEAKACKASLEFGEALVGVNGAFRRDGLPELSVHVGVHEGELFVGNIGCSEHVNFTVCGTPANTAARIEQLSKEYGLSPLVSGDVAQRVCDEFLCVWVDSVVLRGHESTTTEVYHLAARLEDAEPSQTRAAELMALIREMWVRPDNCSVVRAQEALMDPAMAPYRVAIDKAMLNLGVGAEQGK
eukprot:m51a1_g13352 putative protein (196) ;mRNA; r:1815-2402